MNSLYSTSTHTPTQFSIWNKAENLKLLENYQEEWLYQVPAFRCIWENKENLRETIDYFQSIWVDRVSVRSSSENEDTENDSKAWVFQTYLDVHLQDIEEHIDLIQNHSISNFGESIPVIIQEMVLDIDFAGVVFSDSPDDDKPYMMFNYHEGCWEDIVSGNISGNTYRILKNISSESIDNRLHKDLFDAVIYLQIVLKQDNIDIEFAYSKWVLYLLQVRPITTQNNTKNIDDLAFRYATTVSSVLSKNKAILWNMIDINPEELIWNTPPLIQSFFKYIFPDSSLSHAREHLWYASADTFFFQVLGKPFIHLQNNIINFLPATLDKNQQDIFIEYYEKIIQENPELQNQLDSALYPSTLEIVDNILHISHIDDDEKKMMRKKFIVFFSDLEEKFSTLVDAYNDVEKDLLHQTGVDNFLELIELEDYQWDIEDLIQLIQKATYNFTLYVRIFFFESQKWVSEDHDFFEQNFYVNKIKHLLSSQSREEIFFDTPEGFDFLHLVKQSVNTKNHFQSPDMITGNTIDISKVWRENIKFIFMQLFRLLRKKMIWILVESEIILDDIRNAPFDKHLIEVMISWSLSRELLRLDYFDRRESHHERVRSQLSIPNIILPGNNLIENMNFENNGFFIWAGIVEWEVIYAEKVSDLVSQDYKWKVIVLENATPEIDTYLSEVLSIVTKNGWPLSHIAIRSRELDVPAVVGSSYYEKLLASWRPNQVRIDFDNDLIYYNVN